MLPMAMARSVSDSNAIRYVLPVLRMMLFLHDGTKGPESKTTRMLRSVRQVTAPGQSLSSPIASCSQTDIIVEPRK